MPKKRLRCAISDDCSACALYFDSRVYCRLEIILTQAKKRKPKAEKPKKKKVKKAKCDDEGGPKKRTMFSRPVRLSDELAAVLGVTYASRGHAVKLLWV